MNTQEQLLVDQAISLLNKYLKINPFAFTNATHTKDYLCLEMANEWRKVFSVAFLDSKHQFITFKKLFFGDLAEARVYPRVIAKEAILHDAAAIILCHNHPSGQVEPSRSDLQLTSQINDSLELFNIRLLDHIIVSKGNSLSLAEAGYI
ncbi:MAG: JAB domain-containing protein [Gammaproteobacteria bacterium]